MRSSDTESPKSNVERIMVNAIPQPQWLTVKTLATLRANATPYSAIDDEMLTYLLTVNGFPPVFARSHTTPTRTGRRSPAASPN